MFDHLYAYNFLNLKMLTFCTSMQIEDKSCSADANGKSVRQDWTAHLKLYCKDLTKKNNHTLTSFSCPCSRC